MAQDAGRTHYLLNVLAQDELELSEAMATLTEDIHCIAGNHAVTVETVAQHDDGRLRWD